MPTPEEIKKIAVSYSVSRPTEEMPTNPAMAQMIVADALKWLSKDFVIVPKSKVKEIDNIVCDTFSIGNIAVRQSWEYVKRKLFEGGGEK